MDFLPLLISPPYFPGRPRSAPYTLKTSRQLADKNAGVGFSYGSRGVSIFLTGQSEKHCRKTLCPPIIPRRSFLTSEAVQGIMVKTNVHDRFCHSFTMLTPAVPVPGSCFENCLMGETVKGNVYIAIDLKSFYSSVECMERGLDPLTTNLVVADQRDRKSTRLNSSHDN